MNRLQPQFYISFPVVQADYKMLLINLDAYSTLKNNAKFIEFLSKKKDERCPAVTTEELIYMKEDFLNKLKKQKNKSISSLEALHLNVFRDAAPFERYPGKEKNNLYLMTELFFWSTPTANLGSARHALLLDMQIKGIGRNPLAIRHDHSHAWGGQYIWQAMKSYVAGQLLEGASPLGILRTTYVAVKNDMRESPQIRSSEIGLSIREADALRVTQVIADFEPGYRLTKEIVLADLLSKLKMTTIKDHLKTIIFHYASLFLLGLRHMAVTRENVTLEGKLIDYEDIKIDSDASNFYFFVQTKRCKKTAPKNFKGYKGDILYTSAIHFMLNVIMFTSVGFSRLDNNYKININELKNDFLKMIQKLAREVFDVDKKLLSFIELLLTHEPMYQYGQFIQFIPNLKLNSGAKRLLKRMKELDYTILKEEELEDETSTHYSIKFPRVRFKNKFIESYSEKAICSSDKVLEKCFFMLQLESFAGNIDFKRMIDYSSSCNELISKHSLIFPYQLEDNKIVLITKNLKEIKRCYKARIKNELGANLESFDYVQDSDSTNKIVRGARVRLTCDTVHYLSIPPILVR